jgi:hypothetical protein
MDFSGHEDPTMLERLGEQPPRQNHSTAFSHFLVLILKEYGEK